MEGNHVTHSNMDEPTCHLGCYTKRNKWKSLSRVQLSIQSMDFSGQNTGVDRLSVLQGIFPTQGSNLGLPLCRRILYQLSHKGSPSLSLLQRIFPTQELNRGLLHCKRILYQLSYEGSSITKKTNTVQFHLYSVPRAVKIHRDRKYNSGYQGLG